jgi:cation diffusion facilitator CzcD-associated flavoprotein CzcO
MASLPPRAYPRVIIVGAGLGGLMLAILLDKMDVPYHIFERAPKVKPLGKNNRLIVSSKKKNTCSSKEPEFV